MRVISCFNEIIDGVISSITYKVEENSSVIQEATVEIVDDGSKAVLKSNKLFVSDEATIKRSFFALIDHLRKNDVIGLYTVSNTGELSEMFM